MKRLHGRGLHNSPMNQDRTPAPKPTYHHGTAKRLGVTHAPPAPGGAINRGGTFGMGTLKKRK
jgi:hypothetical protein